jgi:hypothetical protein
MRSLPLPNDPLVRLVVVNWLIGGGIGIATALLFLLFNIAGIATLLSRSDIAWAGLLLFFAGFAVTFGSVVAASAVMFTRERD